MGVGNWCKSEFRGEKFSMDHQDVSDFYISCWQRNRSAVPLMLLRGFLFIGCLAIVVASLVINSTYMNLLLWPIFMTHWGLLLITLSTGVSFYISCQAYFKGPLDGSLGLPRSCQIYWVIYNTSIPVALLITIVYWAFLANDEFMEIPDHMIVPNMDAIATLDIFIHLVNSLVMLLLLITDRQPSRLVHFYQPILFGAAYGVFNIVYYFAGGKDPFGNSWIYPILDWDQPVTSSVMFVLIAIILVILHFFVVILAVLRDSLSRRIRKNSNSMSLENYD